MSELWTRHRDSLIIVLSFAGALAVGALLLLILGIDPLEAYGAMLSGAFGTTDAVLATLARAVPLCLSALAISIAFWGGMWNIGAEGQLYVGAFAAAFAGFSLPALPHLPFLIVVLAAGVLVGALWAYLPGRLSLDLGMNIVVITIMLNSVGIYLTQYLASGPYAEEGGFSAGSTAMIHPLARFARFSDLTTLNTGAIVALAVALGITLLMLASVWGYEARMIRLNARFAAAGGVDVRSRQLLAMTLSGALAGLAGTLLVMGDHGRFLSGISPGYTWTGMILSMMVAYHPVGAILAGLVYAAMSSGALEMELLTDAPVEVVEIIVTVAVLFVTAGMALANRLANRIRED